MSLFCSVLVFFLFLLFSFSSSSFPLPPPSPHLGLRAVYPCCSPFSTSSFGSEPDSHLSLSQSQGMRDFNPTLSCQIRIKEKLLF